jgi:lysosomal alpha-glucosidase
MAREVSELVEDGKSPGKHVYSSQPIYLQREKSGSFHVFFYKTASPIDVHYFNGFMKFITIGGVIHLKLFFGNDKPDNAIIKYHDYLGGWILHPFWSSGF